MIAKTMPECQMWISSHRSCFNESIYIVWQFLALIPLGRRLNIPLGVSLVGETGRIGRVLKDMKAFVVQI